MKLTRDLLAGVTDEARDPWAISDGVLYQLCRDYPAHSDSKGVTAKMLLIGRSYAAALERGRSVTGPLDSSSDLFYCRDIPRALGASNLDQRLAQLRSARKLTHHTLSQVLELHRYLCVIFKTLSGRTNRSLASKYLHFHLPNMFFIFDARAVLGLSTFGDRKRAKDPAQHKEWDSEYQRFARKALSLRDQIDREFSVTLTPRQLDRLLLAASDERKAEDQNRFPTSTKKPARSI